MATTAMRSRERTDRERHGRPVSSSVFSAAATTVGALTAPRGAARGGQNRPGSSPLIDWTNPTEGRPMSWAVVSTTSVAADPSVCSAREPAATEGIGPTARRIPNGCHGGPDLGVDVVEGVAFADAIDRSGQGNPSEPPRGEDGDKTA